MTPIPAIEATKGDTSQADLFSPAGPAHTCTSSQVTPGQAGVLYHTQDSSTDYS